MATLQVKRVPDELYDQVRARAEAEGISISEYVLRTLRKDLHVTPLHMWLEDLERDPIRTRAPVDVEALMDEVRGEYDE